MAPLRQASILKSLSHTKAKIMKGYKTTLPFFRTILSRMLPFISFLKLENFSLSHSLTLVSSKLAPPKKSLGKLPTNLILSLPLS